MTKQLNYDAIVDEILDKEKGYVNNPDDRGGPTNHGITEAVARRNGYYGPTEDMPIEFARGVFKKRYISGPGFDAVARLSEKIAGELIDTGVNMGTQVASAFLQRLLNALNNKGSRYADVFVDGVIGGITLEALDKYLRWRGAEGETVMYRGLNGVQTSRYLSIAENNESQETFFYGWLLKRVD